MAGEDTRSYKLYSEGLDIRFLKPFYGKLKINIGTGLPNNNCHINEMPLLTYCHRIWT